MRAACGRAALQGRESRSESVTALAAVATICRAGAFFSSLFSHAMRRSEHGFLKLNSLQAETDARQPWPGDQLEQPH